MLLNTAIEICANPKSLILVGKDNLILSCLAFTLYNC